MSSASGNIPIVFHEASSNGLKALCIAGVALALVYLITRKKD
jgi:hypothetical protein